jgi:hypothetical protein
MNSVQTKQNGKSAEYSTQHYFVVPKDTKFSKTTVHGKEERKKSNIRCGEC